MTDPELRCSAKGCRAPAGWALSWNNPKLHETTRRKTWLACDAHREHLSSFLSARGFLREVSPVHPASAEGCGGTAPRGGSSREDQSIRSPHG